MILADLAGCRAMYAASQQPTKVAVALGRFYRDIRLEPTPTSAEPIATSLIIWFSNRSRPVTSIWVLS